MKSIWRIAEKIPDKWVPFEALCFSLMILVLGCSSFTRNRVEKALQVDGTAALDERSEDISQMWKNDSWSISELMVKEICARRYERASKLAGDASVSAHIRNITAHASCGSKNDSIEAVRGWVFYRGFIEYASAFSNDLLEYCRENIIPPCPECLKPGTRDYLPGDPIRPIVVRCSARIRSGENYVVVSAPDDAALAKSTTIRAAELVEQKAAIARKSISSAPAWQKEYWPPADVVERMRAMSQDEMSAYRSILAGYEHSRDEDPALLPAFRPYFAGARSYIAQYLLRRDYDNYNYVGMPCTSQRKAFLKDAALPDRFAALKATGRLFFKDGNRCNAPGDEYGKEGKAQILHVISADLMQLRFRAAANGHLTLASDADFLYTMLHHPIGIDAQLYELMKEIRKNSQSPFFGWFDLPWGYQNVLGISIDTAMQSYPVARIRVRLINKNLQTKSGRQSYESLSYHRPTQQEYEAQSAKVRMKAFLSAQIAEVEDEIAKVNSAGQYRSESASGVTEYRCDRGTGLNCRAVRQGGGESAASYYHRTRIVADGRNLLQRRDELLAELRRVESIADVPAYDKQIKSYGWNEQSATVEYEIEKPDGSVSKHTLSEQARSKVGRDKSGYGLSKEALRNLVFTNIFLSMNKHLTEEILKLRPISVKPDEEKIRPEPYDAKLNDCVTKDTDYLNRLVNCLAEAGIAPQPR